MLSARTGYVMGCCRLTSFRKKLHRMVTGVDAPEEKKVRDVPLLALATTTAHFQLISCACLRLFSALLPPVGCRAVPSAGHPRQQPHSVSPSTPHLPLTPPTLPPVPLSPPSSLLPLFPSDELKEKRRQKMFKAGADARQRKKEERDALLAQQAAILAQEEEERRADPLGYVQRLHQRKAELTRRKGVRGRRVGEVGGRKTVSSRKRMALLAQQMGRKERGEGGGGGGDGGGGEKEDNFGANDEDWQVYKDAALPSKLGGEADEESEEEREELTRIEEKLTLYDPTYLTPAPPPPHAPELDYQLTLWVDRMRAPELVWQPALVGLDEAGLGESIRRILARMEGDVAVKLCKEVWLMGGGAGYDGYVERLEREVRGVREVGADVRVRRGQGPLDAWKGGRMIAGRVWEESGGDVASMCKVGGGWGGMVLVSRAEYEEMGGEYLKEHRWGNAFFPTPPADQVASHTAIGGQKKRKR